jgi:hypothetical protein
VFPGSKSGMRSSWQRRLHVRPGVCALPCLVILAAIKLAVCLLSEQQLTWFACRLLNNNKFSGTLPTWSRLNTLAVLCVHLPACNPQRGVYCLVLGMITNKSSSSSFCLVRHCYNQLQLACSSPAVKLTTGCLWIPAGLQQHSWPRWGSGLHQAASSVSACPLLARLLAHCAASKNMQPA